MDFAALRTYFKPIHSFSNPLLPFVTVFLVLPIASFSQSGLGSWNVLNVKTTLSPKWGIFAEGQIRSLKFYNHFHYYEMKGGLNYTATQNLQLGMAGGHYNTYQSGGDFIKPKRSDEVRLWEQITMRQPLGRITVEHRYRAEQRWTQINFRHRFRYRINAKVPLNKSKVGTNALYGLVWNEIFFTNREPYFERNRIFAGLGYELTNSLTLQGGYLYQFDYFLDDEIGRQFLQLSALFDLSFRKSNDSKISGNVD